MPRCARRSGRPRSRRAPRLLWTAGLAAAVLAAVCLRAGSREGPGPAPAPEATSTSYGYRVVHAYPHDPDAFTQGLIFRDGDLIESTGQVGASSLRRVRVQTGDVVQHVAIDAPHFAEGLTDWRDTLVQLTYTSQVGFVYDARSFSRLRTFRYTGEGWGLTHDASRIIMSDGTSTLRLLDPASLAEVGRLPVTEDGRPVAYLNELEFVKGAIYANVWLTDDIVMISPATGRVTGRLDLGGLRASIGRTARPIDVLNGIAYDAAGDRLFVTGKYWPTLFEIRIVPSS